jgi:predicted RNase H-like nuclease
MSELLTSHPSGKERWQFIGIDPAWSNTRPSGLAVLEWTDNGLRLLEPPISVRGLNELLLKLSMVERSVIAIDAPLIITNQSGQRSCETMISKLYGRFHAGAHSCNLTRHAQAPSLRLASYLSENGYRHFPVAKPRASRVMLEVYPHPALVTLFDLKTVIRYKKGCVGNRRKGLRELQAFLRDLIKAELPLLSTDSLTDLLAVNTDGLAGATMKDYEDQLDALVCAYLAALSHCPASPRVKAIGDVETGYIVIPTHTATGRVWPTSLTEPPQGY